MIDSHEFYHWFFFDSLIIISIITNMNANGYSDGKFKLKFTNVPFNCVLQFVEIII